MTSLHPEFLLDDQNRKKAVVIPFSEWEKILEDLEELEDIRAYDEAKSQPSDPIPFERAMDEIESGDGG